MEYGDFECPFCGRAEPEVRELLRDFSDVRYVWRHLPISDVHLHAEPAAEAAEAAAAQDAFWRCNGTPAAVTVAAVLVYRVILFWLPLLAGAVAFISLRRGLNRPERPELCVVPEAT